MARTKNFAEYLKAKLANDPSLAKAVEHEALNAHIAQRVHELRSAAKLTQKELANQIGTQQSVISRIEDADYESHSLTLLKKIADAFGKELSIEFKDAQEIKTHSRSINRVANLDIMVHTYYEMVRELFRDSVQTSSPTELKTLVAPSESTRKSRARMEMMSGLIEVQSSVLFETTPPTQTETLSETLKLVG